MRCSLLILLVLVSACHSRSKNGLTKELDNPQLFRDGGILMLLPGVFVRSTLSDITDPRLPEMSEGPGFIFQDTTNAKNMFYFTEAPYLDVEEGAEEKMFSEFEAVIMAKSKKMGTTCQLVENDHFLLSNGDRVFKMCYRVAAEYSTTYFVASKTRVVMVIVLNGSDDGEATV